MSCRMKNLSVMALPLVCVVAGSLASGDDAPRMPAAKQALIRHERAAEAARQEYLRKLIELDRTLVGELEAAKRAAMSASNLEEANRIEAAAAAARERLAGRQNELAGRQTMTFTIRADQDWQPTIVVAKGNRVDVEASGTWCADVNNRGARTTGPDGQLHQGRQAFYLEGRVGDGPAFHLGATRSFVANEGGELQMRMHETGIRSNNDGEMSVSVTVAR